MEESSDGAYLLSYDSQSLKIWDKQRRVVIKNYSPEKDILKAHFIDAENTVCVITESGLSFYEDFEFGVKESTEYFRFSGIADAAYDTENQVIYLAQETSNTYAQIIRYDIAAKASKTIYKSDFREFLITKDPNWHDKHMRRITYSAKYKMLALNFAYRGVFKLIDLRTGEPLSEIDQAKRPYGFLPNGEMLSVTKSSTHMLINYLNPVTHKLKEVARFPLSSSYDKARVYMPHNARNLLIVQGYETTAIFDPRTSQTITQHKPADLTTSAFPLKDSKTLIFGQALTGNFGSVQIGLNQYNSKDGAFLKSWGATAFLPQSLHPRSDAFEFLVQQEFETRRVQITDNGLSSEVIPTPEVLYLEAAYYNTNKNRWLLGDSRNPSFIEYNPDSKFDLSKPTQVKAPSFFSQIHFIDETSDGTIQALHGRTAVVVYDPINETTLLATKLETTGGFAFGKTQMVAISPQGKYLAYVYQNNSPKENTWHLVCQDISSGKTLWSRNHSIETRAVDHLKFSEDGRLLYVKGLDLYGLSSIYATTGEVFQKYKPLGHERYRYNKAGTLAVAWTQKTIRVISLPSGETLVELPNDQLYDELQFILKR
jgi:WD40 repeat protein